MHFERETEVVLVRDKLTSFLKFQILKVVEKPQVEDSDH